MVLDPVRNFAVGVLASGISESDTTITLHTGQGDKFPPTSEGSYNCVIWNSTDYTNPADDPNVEIVRVVSRSGDTFTVQRGQEGTTAVAHNETGKTYKMMLAFTKKSYDDIDTWLDRVSKVIEDTDKDTSVEVEASPDEDKIRFKTAGSERVTIDENGNVGIGTTSPSEKLDVNGNILANNILIKVAEVEVSSDCDYVEFDNLDGNSAWFYELLSTIKNPSSVDAIYKIFFNGNETDVNYYAQYFEAMGSSLGYDRVNRPELTHTKTGHSCGQDTVICCDPQGYVRWFSKISRFNGSEVRASLYCGCSAVTFPNITSIKIVATTSGGIGAGSKFVLFKARRG